MYFINTSRHAIHPASLHSSLRLPAETVPRKPTQNADMWGRVFCTLATLSLWKRSEEVLRGDTGGHRDKGRSVNWYGLSVLCCPVPLGVNAGKPMSADGEQLGHHSWKKIRESEDLGSHCVPLNKSVYFCGPQFPPLFCLGLGLEFTLCPHGTFPHL